MGMENQVLESVIKLVLENYGRNMGSIDDIMYIVSEELVNNYMYSESDANNLVNSDDFIDLVNKVGSQIPGL